ncbi:MAG: glycosyltransferase family 39 protein [Chloroflexi bacterium]|nr:glycosyltransferase family 39 protein [Chloroflexota bacterium]
MLKLKFSPRTFYISLAVVCLLAFGLLIPWLGYYWDDWETILVGRLFPLSEFWKYFSGDRPFAAWTYMVFAPLAGSTPITWHIVSLVLRFFTALGFWWVFGMVWPQRRRQMAWAALLFAVYPLFRQQPIAVSYHQHWVAFALYFASLGCMLKAAQSTRLRGLWMALSAVGELLHLGTLEYFVGIELLRPVLLWLALRESTPNKAERLKKTFLFWLPYLLILAAFSGWRVWYAQQGLKEVNSPVLLFDLIRNPISALTKLISHVMQDGLYVLAGAWFDTLDPAIAASFPAPFFLMTAAVVVGLGVGLYLYLLNLDFPEDHETPRAWTLEALGVSLLAVLLGGVQIWITDRQAFTEGGMFSDRFMLPAMFGAALVWVVLIDWLARNTRAKILLISFLVSIAAGLHMRTANSYRWSWTYQKRVYWQLYWRAPWIEPETLMLQDDLPFPYVLPTFSYRLLYNQPRQASDLFGGFYRLEREFAPDSQAWLEGKEIYNEYRNMRIGGNTLDSLVMYYEPPHDTNCLWILDAEDADHPLLPDVVIDALPLSNLGQIKTENPYGEAPDARIFGPEPAPDWCYYYQKATLARQLDDWGEVARLGDEALNQGFDTANPSSNSPYEWIPFIQAYARDGQWQKAADLLNNTYQTDTRYQAMLCRVWGDLEAHLDEAERAVFDEAASRLECAP